MLRTLGMSTLLLAIVFTACSDEHSRSNPTSPVLTTPQPPPPDPVVSTSTWTVTKNWESYRGPDSCMAREIGPLPGKPFELSTWVEIRVSSVRFVFELDSDLVTIHTGTLVSNKFDISSRGPGLFSSWECADGTSIDVEPLGDRAVGSFSEDGSRLVAVETRRGRLASGESIEFDLRWSGVRKSVDR